MRIVSLEDEPFHVLPYVMGTGVRGCSGLVPFHRARVEGLPGGVEAVIATGDLQGTVSIGAGVGLSLGEAVARELEALRPRGELPPKQVTGALLTGDLYARADEGDVCGVWRAMGGVCGWVVGVAGNHDLFGGCGSIDGARRELGQEGLHLLDDDTVRINGMTIGGVSGIVGAWVRGEGEFAAAVGRLAGLGLDLLISHDGPNVAGTALSGWPSVRRALEASPATLVVRGHDAWSTPLVQLGNGTQVLNVEGRVVVLRRGVG